MESLEFNNREKSVLISALYARFHWYIKCYKSRNELFNYHEEYLEFISICDLIRNLGYDFLIQEEKVKNKSWF